MEHLRKKERWWHEIIQRIAATEFGIWLLADNLHRLDQVVLKLTQNRESLTSWLTGLPVVVLENVGAKSGLLRRTPLLAVVEGQKIILIASNFGNIRHPAWYYNLKKNPDAAISIGEDTCRYHARESEGEERERYWRLAEALYPGFKLYKRKAAPRKIPVMVLDEADS